jgi:hypothetical protein
VAGLHLGRVGRRGSFLIFLALLDLLFGYSLLTPAGPQGEVDLYLPEDAWAWIWIGVGVVCLFSAFVKSDRIAFTLAATLLIMWSGLMAIIWHVDRIPRGWVSAVIFFAFGIVCLIVSSWPEPPKIIDPPRGPEEFLREEGLA